MNFGKLSEAYDAGRQTYPTDVMDYIFSLIGISQRLLDVGCGTGISTRQLARQVKDISGCDVDAKMIETAQKYTDEIRYYVASTSKMPFGNEEFDVLTAFGAFHWFCDDESVVEIKRVLRFGGAFVVINKNEAGDFRKNYEKIIEQVTGVKPPQSIKKEYSPGTILEKNGFSNIITRKFQHTEEFSVLRAIEQIQSMSLWNTVPNEKKQEVLEVLRSHFGKIAEGGMVHRYLEVVVVSGVK